MPKRKKRMKLPNGFGTIKYLGSGRRRPYGAYPPVAEYTDKGSVQPKALGYYETWEEAYEYLTAWHLEQEGKIKVKRGVFLDNTPTFSEVYAAFYDEKYNRSAKKLSKASSNSTAAAFGNCSALHSTPFGLIKYGDLQAVVDSCQLKYSSLELIVSLFHQMYKYAIKYDIVDTDYSQHVYIPIPDDDESGEPFTDRELSTLWSNKNNRTVQMILIMCYSGYRIRAYADMTVDLSEMYFKGGVKTKAGKDRIVPIHSGILSFVKSRYNGKNLLGCSTQSFRIEMYEVLSSLGISATASGKRHTPHDCRHTFSALCERYGVNENDRKRMLGHSFGADITNGIYGHRSLEELRAEIEKIKISVS